MEKGDLVQRIKDGSVGIVLGAHEAEAEILFGDGGREIENMNAFNVIDSKPRSGSPANFAVMVDAYLESRGF